MANPVLKKYYTEEEYFELLEDSLEKLEYHDGEIFTMAGGSINHSRICNTIGGILREKLKGKPCSAFNSDLMISYNNRNYLFTDVSVICGKPKNSEKSKNAVTNPRLIVEVLSPETTEYDRGVKFKKYQEMDSFVEYVLISQDKIWVDVFYKPENTDFWQYKAYSKKKEIIVLKSLEIEIVVADLYEEVF